MSLGIFGTQVSRGGTLTVDNVPVRRRLPLQVIGALSALIFAFNFCLEIFALLSHGIEKQVLILAVQLILASWAIVEAVLLARREPSLPLSRLILLLVLQLLLESFRLSFALWGKPFGVEGHFGVLLVNLGPLAILLPLYVLTFFAISRALMIIYSRELDDAWLKLTEVAVAQSKQQEREQLLRDMHDGFGSQIATMRIMAEHGRLSTENLPRQLEEISADLHLVVDTFAQASEITLSGAIADMRYRLRQRIDAGNTRLHWQIELPPEPHLDPRSILNILRIIQEAINNALRHGRPTNIWIEAVGASQRPIRISVRDDGSGAPEMLRRGRGLSNMETRARELGGHIQWISEAPGLKVELLIPAIAETRSGP